MGGILSSLNTSYTGLSAHQVMVDVTGNNISNASDEFYSRQRTIVRPERPLYYQGFNIGRGVSVETIARVHDEFVFSRYRRASEESQFYNTHFEYLREASAFFPEVDEVESTMTWSDILILGKTWQNTLPTQRKSKSLQKTLKRWLKLSLIRAGD